MELSDEDMVETLNEIKGEVEEEETEEAPEIEAEAPETEEEPPEEEVVAEVEEEPEEEPENPTLVNPPSTWRAAAKTKWKSIDPEIRAEIKKREQDAINGINSMKEKAESADRLVDVMRPYEAIIKAEGGSPETVVQQMLSSAYILRQGSMRQKVEMTAQLAQQYGFFNELRSLLTENTLPAPQGITPDEVERRVEAKLAEERNRQQSTQYLSQVEEFANSQTEDGSLQYPYFDNVRGLMASMIEADTNLTLEAAYERAIWADPETRTVMQQQSVSEDQVKVHAEKAKKAVNNNLRKKASHVSEQPKPTGSVDDTMKETLASIKARSG